MMSDDSFNACATFTTVEWGEWEGGSEVKWESQIGLRSISSDLMMFS
jgi:hypothetical protein